MPHYLDGVFVYTNEKVYDDGLHLIDKILLESKTSHGFPSHVIIHKVSRNSDIHMPTGNQYYIWDDFKSDLTTCLGLHNNF